MRQIISRSSFLPHVNRVNGTKVTAKTVKNTKTGQGTIYKQVDSRLSSIYDRPRHFTVHDFVGEVYMLQPCMMAHMKGNLLQSAVK